MQNAAAYSNESYKKKNYIKLTISRETVHCILAISLSIKRNLHMFYGNKSASACCTAIIDIQNVLNLQIKYIQLKNVNLSRLVT